MKRLVTVVDLGSNKIAACAAAIDRSGHLSIVALDSLHSRGINGGDITDLNKAVEDLSSVLKRLERQKKRKIRNVFVTASGIDIETDVSRGMVPLAKTPREITRRDVKKCLEIARMTRLPMERTILENVVRGFYIDGGKMGITNPVGLYGMKLEVETFIVTTSQSKLQNIAKCIDHAGFLLDGIRLSSVASANSVLETEEKENGVLLLDIGDTLTETLVFRDNMLKDLRVIKKGASNVLDKNMRVDKPKLDAFLGELVDALSGEEENFSSVVVTGGGALLDGAIEVAEKMFKIPARIGIVKRAGRNLNSQDAIIHTSTLGLINAITKEYEAHNTYKNPIHKAFRKVLDIYESYF
ncbi:MAG: cell division protein FtsA [Candidatus Omnitrophica bacterium]|nr:cell division protein FtsA [Candidatus Omnitrophota bacterium]